MGINAPSKGMQKRRQELNRVKEIFGVTGYIFYKEPYFGPTVVPTECREVWTCNKVKRYDNDIREIMNTHPKTLHRLLDGLLNLEENPNPPEIMFNGTTYNNLEDLWKAMGKI